MPGGLGNKLKNSFSLGWRPYYYWYAGGLSFLLGIIIGSFFGASYFYLYLFLLIALASLFIWPRFLLVKVAAVVVLGVALGIARWQSAWPTLTLERVEWYQGREVKLLGVVAAESEQRMDKQKVILQVNKINDQPGRGRVLLTLPLFPRYDYGDVLLAKGKIKQPPTFADFAYDKYLARFNIYAVSYYPQVSKLGEGQGSSLLLRLLRFKEKLVRRVNLLFPEPTAAFLGGLLWGAKRSIPPAVMENFNLTGTTHIIALSGYNIMVLAAIVFWLAPWLGINRRLAYWLVIVVIIFFVVITGLPASVVRAAIMGILTISAYRFGGGHKIGIILLLAAVAMCAVNPKILLYDVGFQLSFLATIGLIYLAPFLQSYFYWLPHKLSVREGVITTLAAIILTTPLVIYQFGRFSLVALPANLLILFVIPIIMAVGFMAVVVSFVHFAAGQLLAWLALLLLYYPLIVTDQLAKLPYAALTFVRAPRWLLLFLYLIILAVIFKLNLSKKSYVYQSASKEVN